MGASYVLPPSRAFLSHGLQQLYPRAIATTAAVLAEEEGRRTGGFFPKKGEEVEMECESLAYKGKGVCKVVATGFVGTCNRALPGERFIARMTKRNGSFMEDHRYKTFSMCNCALPGVCFITRMAKRSGSFMEFVKVKTLLPHHNAVTPPCKYAADCGGCTTQNLAYGAQIQAKEQQVFDLISRVGRFGTSSDYMRPIVGCKYQFHYRNKMEFSFGNKECLSTDINSKHTESGFVLGLHAPGRFDEILSIRKCLLQENAANEALKKVHEYCRSHTSELSAYDPSTHMGFLRHLMIRSGRDCNSGEVQLMVNFVTLSYQPGILLPLVDELVSAVPNVVSIVNNVNSSLRDTSCGEKEYVMRGKSTITESLCGLVFEISANSFFQTNPRQAEVLYRLVEDAAMLQGDGTEIVLDLFCGTGAIGLTLAKRAKHVYGYEIIPEAIANARENAFKNNISNATFIQGDLNKITNDFGKKFPKPDVVITDPNRPGMHPKLIEFLLQLRAQRIVYVSCNPATCARDLDLLCHAMVETSIKGAYHLVSVQPVDMFPNTPHIECVCLLELK